MLMEDGGEKLSELIAAERDLSRWRDVLPLYASVQIDLVDDVAEMLALGVPDFRLASLAGKVEVLIGEIVEQPVEERRRLEASLPWVRSACEELAAAGIPETIQHDDLHDSQVFVRDGRYLLLDWGDSCISHPFFSLAVTLDGVIAWGVDDVEGSERPSRTGTRTWSRSAPTTQADSWPSRRTPAGSAGSAARSTASLAPSDERRASGSGCSWREGSCDGRANRSFPHASACCALRADPKPGT